MNKKIRRQKKLYFRIKKALEKRKNIKKFTIYDSII